MAINGDMFVITSSITMRMRTYRIKCCIKAFPATIQDSNLWWKHFVPSIIVRRGEKNADTTSDRFERYVLLTLNEPPRHFSFMIFIVQVFYLYDEKNLRQNICDNAFEWEKRETGFLRSHITNIFVKIN